MMNLKHLALSLLLGNFCWANPPSTQPDEHHGVDAAKELRFSSSEPRWGGANNAIINFRNNESHDGNPYIRLNFKNFAVGEWAIKLELARATKPDGTDRVAVAQATLWILDDRLLLEKFSGAERSMLESDPEDTFDGPMEIFNLMNGMLGYLFPGGPGSIADDVKVDQTEKVYTILAKSGTDDDKCGPPWSVIGEVKKLGDGKISYDLKISGTNASDLPVLNNKVDGLWWKDPSMEPFDRKMEVRLSKVDGWRAFALHPWREIPPDATKPDATESIESLLAKAGPASLPAR